MAELNVQEEKNNRRRIKVGDILGTAGFILGVLGLYPLSFGILSLCAIILGVLALLFISIAKTHKGRGTAIAAVIIGIAGILWFWTILSSIE